MGDYIERAAALNVNFKIPTRFSESKLTTARKAVQEYANEIAKIPAADVRPVVRGKWERASRSLMACSSCGNCVVDDRISGLFFCPNCGAMMEES